MRNLLFVGLGGFFGAIARYSVGLWIDARAGTAFPYATLTINLGGSFVLGVLAGAFEFGSVSPEARLALGVGFLGAFTTFSTFTYEIVRLVDTGSATLALLYVVASAALGITAAILGLALGRALG